MVPTVLGDHADSQINTTSSTELQELPGYGPGGGRCQNRFGSIGSLRRSPAATRAYRQV